MGVAVLPWAVLVGDGLAAAGVLPASPSFGALVQHHTVFSARHKYVRRTWKGGESWSPTLM